MKKTIAFIVIMMITITAMWTCNAQIWYGFNGTNSPANLTPEVCGKIASMYQPGQTMAYVFRNDKYPGKCPDVEITNMIRLRDSLRAHNVGFKVIYTFNARGVVSIADNFYAYDNFTAAGIEIPADRMGNEEWAKVAHNQDWPQYVSDCTPIIDALNTRNFTGKIIFSVAKPDNTIWNTPAITFINSSPQYEPDIHFYLSKDECPILAEVDNDKPLPVELSTSNGYLPIKDSFYHDVYFQGIATTYFSTLCNFIRTNFPGKKMWVTEFGPPVGVGPIGGALGFEALTDYYLNLFPADITACACKFNCCGAIGAITGTNAKDSPAIAGAYIERLSYWTMKQFLHNTESGNITPIYSDGTYTFRFQNMNPNSIDFEGFISVAEGLEISSVNFEAISGEYFYSSSGVMQWWATGSDRTYDISGSQIYNYIPAMSFGYIHVTVVRTSIPGCMDPKATNYNPLATVDDRSCTYPPPPPPPSSTCSYKWPFKFLCPKKK